MHLSAAAGPQQDPDIEIGRKILGPYCERWRKPPVMCGNYVDEVEERFLGSSFKGVFQCALREEDRLPVRVCEVRNGHDQSSKIVIG